MLIFIFLTLMLVIQMKFDLLYQQLCVHFIGRIPSLIEQVSELEILVVEQRLQRVIPKSLRYLYLTCGRCIAITEAHNFIRPIEKIEIEDGYLVFMDENQSVVSWGLPLYEQENDNPLVWQRNNNEPIEWFSEDKGLYEFLESMFYWYREVGIWQDK